MASTTERALGEETTERALPEDELAAVHVLAGRFGTEPYLVTVTAGHEPHCAVVSVDWDLDSGLLVVPAPRSWPGSDSSGHRRVSLLWPPAERGGYSLIVDGLASRADGRDAELLAVAPMSAVLHRRGQPSSPGGACGSDCVRLLDR